MKTHPVTIALRYDLYRRLRRIADNENTTPELVALDMLSYQLETVGHGRARAHTEPFRQEKMCLPSDDFELDEPCTIGQPGGECEGCQ